MDKIKIASLELENVKRIKSVIISPDENGLTIIGGKNGQGKTSVLDSLAWALGGDRFKPSQPDREGSTIPPHLTVTLSNGLLVERKGKNSDLKVTDPSGNRAGQSLLNEFISALALDLPKFMNASGKEKADTLLQIIGVGEKLYELELSEKRKYDERLYVGRDAEQKAKYAAELTFYEGLSEDLISPSELIKTQQEILARNGENQRKRDNAARIRQHRDAQFQKVINLRAELKRLEDELDVLNNDLQIADKTASELRDESTEELERSIASIDETNAKIRVNLDKQRAEDEAKRLKDIYDSLTTEIESIRKDKYDLLNSAELPLLGLTVEYGELKYNGFSWDNMSGSEQLKVATAIVRKLNPQCGFVLLDKLEQMDTDTLNEFGEWLKSEGLQAIATRVSTGDECSIIIEDGYSSEVKKTESKETELKSWKAGTF